MNAELNSILWLLGSIVLGIFILAGTLAGLAFLFSNRSQKYKAMKTKLANPATTPAPLIQPAATAAASGTAATATTSANSVVTVQNERKPQISAVWFVRILAFWTVLITGWFLWNHPENWKRDLLVAGVVLSVLLIVGTPHLPKSDDKKKDSKGGYTIVRFVGHVLQFLIVVPLALILLGSFYYWIFLPAYRSTYGIEEPRGQGVSKTFPYKITIPFSPDPSGAYSAPLHVPDGGKIQFDWNNFPKNVWLDICWNGNRVTRMRPVNDRLWKEPWGTNINTMEFKAVLVPAGTTTVELGYSLK